MAGKTKTVKNKTIAELSQWAADPAKMARFEALALLSQRTLFLKNMLGLRDNDDVIRMQVQAVCAKHGVECKMPRGNGIDGEHLKSITSHQRYIISFLLNTVLATTCGGIAQSDEGLDTENLIDRLVYAYRRYLALAVLTPAQAEVSFEMFYVQYKAYNLGQVDLTPCNNCGANFVNLRVSQSIQCPLCITHRHAVVPGKSQAAHSVPRSKQQSIAA
jgi:hypothetical protein